MHAFAAHLKKFLFNKTLRANFTCNKEVLRCLRKTVFLFSHRLTPKHFVFSQKGRFSLQCEEGLSISQPHCKCKLTARDDFAQLPKNRVKLGCVDIGWHITHTTSSICSFKMRFRWKYFISLNRNEWLASLFLLLKEKWIGEEQGRNRSYSTFIMKSFGVPNWTETTG